ncbi:MAG: DNA-directed RNA polymerase subunit beta' [Candidatus Babeliaceae bacterium]|nr:DNA-directed RNA polymerase subunit beta' [Candidatus Babeliaceae bacterium]
MSNQLLERFREYIKTDQFNALKIGLASPEKIKSLSYGEVKKIETINYRTLKPERDGLFCARIFGPVKDWECTCGKYKRMKHRGITCEKCGVDVIESRVRRERMGRIMLVSPVCHIWYLKGIPSYLSLVLDVPVRDLERVVYFDMNMVVAQGRSPYPQKTLLSTQDCDRYRELHPEDTEFEAEIGAEAVRRVLSMIDLPLEISKLEEEYQKNTSVAGRHRIMRRLKILSGFFHANLRPEWMILTVLPVLPPDLRPLVPLEGGRFASSDLNELYRRVLNRNIRLQRLMEIDAPSVIIKNERRMLQEAVDALIDNGRRGQPVRGTNKRPLKSLSEMLRGKQGRFRQNLLGKRVDYSGRSVIVVDPELHIDQCGIPKLMALELFKAHVYAELLRREIAPNLRVAKRLVEESVPEVWDALEYIVRDYPVLLNRAPTLHRLGIQAFYPILVDGKAIKIHPLVCGAYNADFDGDQMAVHVPLSHRARLEASKLMLASTNLLSAANGKPVATPSQDMILGLHYLSKVRSFAHGEGTVFSSVSEVVTAYQCGSVALHARIRVRLQDENQKPFMVETTVGRSLLFAALPEHSDFDWINRVLAKKDLQRLIESVYYRFGAQPTVETLDRIKKLGFFYATMGGISFSIDKLKIPEKKPAIIAKTERAVQKVEALYLNGSISNVERANRIVNLWDKATRDIADEMNEELRHYDKEAFENKDRDFQEFNSIFMAIESKARGSVDQIKQLAGMRGLMAKPSGEIMETPVISNFKEGLSVFEYFISTHGARKGQADTALKTANSGYLTRRLVDAAQDVVVSMNDCHTFGSVIVEDLHDAGDVLLHLAERVYGRVAAEDVRDPVSGQILVPQGTMIGREEVTQIRDSAVSRIAVRSGLTCQAKRGVCACCYGMDLSTGKLVDVGLTVGIIAAQSIGEPGTQLTMRTFHIGGTASLAEHSSFAAKHRGIVQLRNVRTVENRDGQLRVLSRRAKLFIVSEDGRELQRHDIEYGAIIFVKDGDHVQVGDKLVEWDNSSKVILTEQGGTVQYVDLVQNITMQERYDETTNRFIRVVLEHKSDKYQPALSISDAEGEEVAQYYLPVGSYLNVEPGDKVLPGDVLVKIPREASRTRDITGGLPRIAELFEARVPKDPAILADCDGDIVIGGLHRGMRKVSVVGVGETFDYHIPRGKQLNVTDGDRVRAGDALTTGSVVLHDMLRVLGPDALQRYLVDQIQGIYRLQGIEINDRHIELIVRQMLRKVRVTDPGDTDFLVGDRVDRIHFQAVNEALTAEGKKSAAAQPMLMGITLASLGTESFISAASFQETTRVLAEAALEGSIDYLYGLKENVIIGKLIPAGTGVASFRKEHLGDSEQ